MSLAAIVRALIDTGATPQMILAAVEADERSRMEEIAIQRENARQRKIKSRNINNHVTVTPVTDCDIPLNGFNGFPHPSLTSLNPPKENTPKGVQKKVPQEKGHSERFLHFWKIFPKARAGSKDNAWRAWRKATCRASEDEIIAGCMAYSESNEAKTHPKGAAAWLNDDRWTVEYATIDRATGPPKETDEQRFARLAREMEQEALERKEEDESVRYRKSNQDSFKTA
jgi:hypothetical protein